MISDPEMVRRRTTHGWAFSDLTAEVENRVKTYLADGNPDHLTGTSYQALRDGVLSRMSNKERRDNGLPIPKIEKPAPEKLACGHEDSDHHVHVSEIDGRDIEVLFIILKDGRSTLEADVAPELLLKYFEIAAEGIRDGIRKDKGGLN